MWDIAMKHAHIFMLLTWTDKEKLKKTEWDISSKILDTASETLVMKDPNIHGPLSIKYKIKFDEIS